MVDTAAGHWKDAGRGQGIIYEEHPGRTDLHPRTSFDSSGSISSINVVPGEPSITPEAAAHYASGTRPSGRQRKAAKDTPALKGIMGKLLKRKVKKSTWIYVSVGGRATASFEC